jgi:hypothetical protein
MRTKLLFVSLWRYHKKATLLTLAAVLAIGTALFSWTSDEPPSTAERPGRLLLNRIWFDSAPQTPRDEIGVFIWLAGGIGVYQRGSSVRAAYDIFEFERNGNAFTMTFLQDSEQVSTEFTIEACDEQPPFDLCLTLLNAPRERNRYYGFGAHDELVEHVPWGPRMMNAARAQAALAD